MQGEELKSVFDQLAPSYDRQWAKLAPLRDGLHFLLESVFAELPDDARILCVGVGTGNELAHLAQAFPRWRFTAVEPSGPMLSVCRDRAEQGGFSSRCHFHEGYLDSLPVQDGFDAATCFLVSQFIQDRDTRSAFFGEIADRLRSGGILASSDLAAELGSDNYNVLLNVWLNMMAAAGIPPEGREKMRTAYSTDVAILPAATIASIIEVGGFEKPVLFYQAGLIHAWFSRRA